MKRIASSTQAMTLESFVFTKIETESGMLTGE
jgi:hypothetical protein